MESALRQVHSHRKAPVRKILLAAVAIVAAASAGIVVVRFSPTLPILALLSMAALAAIAWKPRLWLLLVVMFTTVRSYDNAFAGGLLSLSKVLTAVMLVIFLARIAVGRARLHIFRDWALPFALLIIWSIVSLLWSFNRSGAVWAIVSWASLIALQGLIYTLFVDDAGAVVTAIHGYLIAMTAYGLLAIYSVALQPSSQFATAITGARGLPGVADLGVGRFFGFYADPNSVAFMLGYGIFFAIALMNVGRSSCHREIPRTILLSMACIMVVALVVTFSRAGLASFAVGLAFLVRKRASDARIWLFLAVAAAIAYLFRPAIMARFGALQITGYGSRLPELRLGLREFAAAPLTGIGLSSFRPKLRSEGMGSVPVIHNTYLRFLVELGLPGFLILVWFCMALFRRYRRNTNQVNEAASSLLYWLNAGFGASFLATGVWALFLGASSFNPLWILFGLFSVTSVAIERTSNEAAACQS